jgi:subtilisin family serine protease
VLAVKATPATLREQAWHLSQINKPPSLSGAGIRIGVIDTGYDPTLPDLVAPFAPQFAEWQPAQPAQNGRPATKPRMQSGLPPRDRSDNLHGSMVCAFLAGNISGVAPRATVSVAAVPATSVLESQAQIIVALDWLLSLGQDIITTSISTGVPGAVPAAGTVGRGPSLAAVESALGQARTVHKVLLIAASGNIGALGGFQHPGSSVQALVVGAVDAGAALFGSAWGTVASGVHKPDIVAPGYQLHMPKRGGGFYTVGGTSFAASIVAGAAALVLEKHPTLRGNPDALAAKLTTLVRPVNGSPPANSTGAGLLDLSSL